MNNTQKGGLMMFIGSVIIFMGILIISTPSLKDSVFVFNT